MKTCVETGCGKTAKFSCEVEMISGKTVKAYFCDDHISDHVTKCHDGVRRSLT